MLSSWYFSSKPDSDCYISLMCNDPPIFLAFILKAAVLRLQKLQVIAHYVPIERSRIISLHGAQKRKSWRIRAYNITIQCGKSRYIEKWSKALRREADSARMLWDKCGCEMRYIGCTQSQYLSNQYSNSWAKTWAKKIAFENQNIYVSRIYVTFFLSEENKIINLHVN